MLGDAVQTAVQTGKLWLIAGPASLWGEEIPVGILGDAAGLQAPPQPVPSLELLPEKVPSAWGGKTTTALSLATALSQVAGKTLPWPLVRRAIQDAITARQLELTSDSGAWPYDFASARMVKLQVVAFEHPQPYTVSEAQVQKPAGLVAEAELQPAQLQDLAEQIGEIKKAAAGSGLRLRVRIELDDLAKLPNGAIEKINAVLAEVSQALKLK